MFQKYLVEFVGTLLLVYVILAIGDPLAIGATFALVILLAQNISGGYMNPAVTIVMSSYGKIPISDVLPYCLVQVFGGLIALELFKKYKL